MFELLFLLPYYIVTVHFLYANILLLFCEPRFLYFLKWFFLYDGGPFFYL